MRFNPRENVAGRGFEKLRSPGNQQNTFKGPSSELGRDNVNNHEPQIARYSGVIQPGLAPRTHRGMFDDVRPINPTLEARGG